MTGSDLLYLRTIGLAVSVERFAEVVGVHPSTVRRSERRSEITSYMLRKVRASRWWALWRGLQRGAGSRQGRLAV